jgi:LPXTG-motif cell wall-anchored protein
VSVLDIPVAPTITSGSPPNPHVGVAYSFTVTATGNPDPTFSISSGALPPGLTLDPATGVISGTPTSTGSSTFTVTATNGVGTDATATYTLTGTLAATGVDTAPLGIVGAILLALGAIVLVARRRLAPRS